MPIVRSHSDALVVKELPDGSRLVVDSGRETVFALNATAGAAWDACSSPTTLPEVAKKMQISLQAEVPEELAEQTILELQERNLVNTAGMPSQLSRRSFVAKVGMAALPLVAVLSMSDQRAYAQWAKSGANPQGNDSGFDWDRDRDNGHQRDRHHDAPPPHREHPWDFQDPNR